MSLFRQPYSVTVFKIRGKLTWQSRHICDVFITTNAKGLELKK